MSAPEQSLSATMAAFIVATIAVLSCGQILFKRAAGGIDLARPASLLSPQLALALLLYAAATVMWLVVLGRVKLSVAFPFYGLSFVFVPLLAWWWLGEPLGWRSLAGGLLIIAGLMVISGGKGTT